MGGSDQGALGEPADPELNDSSACLLDSSFDVELSGLTPRYTSIEQAPVSCPVVDALEAEKRAAFEALDFAALPGIQQKLEALAKGMAKGAEVATVAREAGVAAPTGEAGVGELLGGLVEGQDEEEEGVMLVDVPEGIGPGDILLVVAPDGSELEIEVPEGVGPGDFFEVYVGPLEQEEEQEDHDDDDENEEQEKRHAQQGQGLQEQGQHGQEASFPSRASLLPPGWQQPQTPDGHTYYADPTGKTSWDPPPPTAQPQQQQQQQQQQQTGASMGSAFKLRSIDGSIGDAFGGQARGLEASTGRQNHRAERFKLPYPLETLCSR